MQIQSVFPAALEEGGKRLAFTLKDAVRLSGLSRSVLYLAIGRGTLHARKCGARTIILDADLRRFLNGLPRFARRDRKGTASREKAL
jgi:hypothetical protein